MQSDVKTCLNLDIDESVLKLVMECACEKDIVFIAEAILVNKCYKNSPQEPPLAWMIDRIRKTYKTTKKECSREPVILVFDDDLQ
nr:hypothetical protein [Tanacetum cinerariifolium]